MKYFGFFVAGIIASSAVTAIAQTPTTDAQARAYQATIGELTQAWVGARAALNAQTDENAKLQGQIRQLEEARSKAEAEKNHPLPAEPPK